jgi:SAM-dependent MidA family methyltransferase
MAGGAVPATDAAGVSERLDAFMGRANAAYYATHDPFADFTTAPEISQVFGELLGLWAAVTWQAMGSPDPVILVETGPGRGTLMRDALRAIAKTAPAFRAALRLHLIETSPRLRTIQAEHLSGAVWHERAEDLPAGPFLLLGNEFLDALPIRQFVGRASGWTERYVRDGVFEEVSYSDGPRPAAEGDVVEVCEQALILATYLGRRIVRDGGAALLLDYGPESGAAGDSLQALRNGKPVDPLSKPGTADLTAHVDFEAFGLAARQAGVAVHGPVPQGLFLARLGLFQRSGVLARSQPPARAAAILDAARRLAEPDRMGRLFKAICLCHPSLPTPAGFES